MWQAMLMAAKLPNTHTIVIDGFITGDGGVKMSKSLGNVVNPSEIVKEYGTDALRYFLLREISSFEDSPFTMERFKEAYNAGLANGLGNLVSRIMKMAEDNKVLPSELPIPMPDTTFTNYMHNFNIQKAIELVWSWIGELDAKIQTEEPFKLVKTNPKKGKLMISGLVWSLGNIAEHLKPFLPETSQKIQKYIIENKMPEKPLFLRKN
jgi:methionyl-tRNA synthetase